HPAAAAKFGSVWRRTPEACPAVCRVAVRDNPPACRSDLQASGGPRQPEDAGVRGGAPESLAPSGGIRHWSCVYLSVWPETKFSRRSIACLSVNSMRPVGEN